MLGRAADACLRKESGAASGLFKERLLAACDEGDAGGLGALREAIRKRGAPGAEARAEAELTGLLQAELAQQAGLPEPLRAAIQALPVAHKEPFD